MQHVNNDIDDLFKKAAENYPLQPGKPDWEKVFHALQQEAPEEEKGNNKKHLLWILLLLLPITLICNQYKSVWDEAGGKEEHAAAQTYSGGRQVNKKPVTPLVPQAGNAYNHLPDQQSAGKQQPASGTTPYLQQQRQNTPAIKTAKAATYNRQKQSKHQVTPKEEEPPAATFHFAIKQAAPDNYAAESSTTSRESIPLLALDQYPGFSDSLQHSEEFSSIRQVLEQDSILNNPLFKKASTSRKWAGKLYGGIVGSADLTSVSLQRTSNVGWQTGLLAGYQFGNRWSVETGLYLSRKYYYTEGAYFSKSRIYVPPNSNITKVVGYCTMLEIPLNFKYDISARRRATWFATGGLTSYFMKKEAYDFLYYYRNSGTYAVYSKSYQNATTNLLSVLQLSGGYSHKLGRNISLRVEPYLKLPITGLGYGKLHFTSTGVNLGLIKRF